MIFAETKRTIILILSTQIYTKKKEKEINFFIWDFVAFSLSADESIDLLYSMYKKKRILLL